MTDFEGLLRATVDKLTKGLVQADRDLHEVVNAVSQSLGRVTNGGLKLELERVESGSNGMIYAVRSVSVRDESSSDMGAFRIGMDGYPLECGQLTPTEWGYTFGPVQTTFANRAELEQWFADLLANPKSPLVENVARLLVE